MPKVVKAKKPQNKRTKSTTDATKAYHEAVQRELDEDLLTEAIKDVEEDNKERELVETFEIDGLKFDVYEINMRRKLLSAIKVLTDYIMVSTSN